MAADKIDLEIVTPKGKALVVSVDEVTAPSVQGEFGVLPGHLPVVAAIRTGIVTYRTGSESKRVAVGPGFAEAGNPRPDAGAGRFSHARNSGSTLRGQGVGNCLHLPQSNSLLDE